MMQAVETIEADVLVIGAGLAGLRAALAAKQAGAARVILAVKGKAGRSGSSAMTTAAYAGVFPGGDPTDSPALHTADTLKGGARVADPALVAALCEGAAWGITALEEAGGAFQREGAQYKVTPSGDHSRPRVLLAPNNQGTDYTVPLAERTAEAGVEMLESVMAVEVVRQVDSVVGAILLDLKGGKVIGVATPAVILATGGAGRLFSVTSNPVDITGDGFSLAYRAGAVLRDMEFIQFYPWRCTDPFTNSRVSIQPSTFVVGARLYNKDGERFMQGGEATTRDVAARAIFLEIQAGRGVEGKGGPGVRLDLSPLTRAEFEDTNPKVAHYIKKLDIDYATYPFVVAPEAHYWMGGLAVDVNGAASLDGLFAVGEVAGGIHGANRINSNALPETQVFGDRAGRMAAARSTLPRGDVGAIAQGWARRLDAGEDGGFTEAELAEKLKALRTAMWDFLGIVRNETGLRSGLAHVGALAAALEARGPAAGWRALRAWCELRSLCDTALLSLTAALHRRESRGAHYRDDCPEPDDSGWLGTLRLIRGADGVPEVAFVAAERVAA
ncbi:FAD-binding protein [Roseomonas sp. AR75]|uniref:FAD-binding protein n=1 Tax=Roseomonas sp. AR75 TaxID=2562311 RepID=UPI00148515B7|nr:FAD-binding protein [Roseomonas sp. AR75]